jgi:hypothetical protein
LLILYIRMYIAPRLLRSRKQINALMQIVCLTPESGRVRRKPSGLLWAKSRHVRCKISCPLCPQ